MPPEPDGLRTKKRREKLLSLGLIQKNVWVPAVFASALMAFALELRRKAGMLLPTDPRENDEAAHTAAEGKLIDGQAPIIEEAVSKLSTSQHPGGSQPRSRLRR